MKKAHLQKTDAYGRRHNSPRAYSSRAHSRARANSVIYRNDDRFDINGSRSIYRYELYDVFDWLHDFSH